MEQRALALRTDNASCARTVVRYVVIPLVVIAIAANIKDVGRYLKLVAMSA